MKTDAAGAQRAIRRLLRQLDDPDALEGKFAGLLVEQAQQNAASRPTPQSALVADSLVVTGNLIRSAAGIPSEVAAGSEFGSDIYPQFQHSHTTDGLWLYPAAEDGSTLKNMDDELEDMIRKAL